MYERKIEKGKENTVMNYETALHIMNKLSRFYIKY